MEVHWQVLMEKLFILIWNLNVVVIEVIDFSHVVYMLKIHHSSESASHFL